jgi:hypothetical protein
VINVWNDAEGVRMALEEIFEQDFARSRIREEGANDETLARMEQRIPPRTLAWGYYSAGEHLLHLESLQQAGVVFPARDLAAFEAEGLVILHRARSGFESRHPACSACGQRQQNRFGRECHACGAKFQRRKE